MRLFTPKHRYCAYAFRLLLALCMLSAKGYAQPPDSLLFRDDFNRTTLGALWETPTSWTTQNGSAYLFAGSERWLRTSTAYQAPSYIIESAALGFTPGYRRSFRLTFGQTDPAIPAMYVLQYDPYFGGILTLGRSTDNYYYPEVLDEGILYPNLASDKWYRFKVARYQSGLIQVYVDKGNGYSTVPVLEAIDSTHTTLGKMAWRVDTETSDEPFFVDWIKVVKPGLEKPAVREKPVPDKLVTQVSAASGRNYQVTRLAPGVKAYTDRVYTITGFPDYMAGASLVQTSMEDKKAAMPTFLTSFIKKRSVLFVGYDPRAKALPAWLSSWTKTGDRIQLTDPGSSYLDVYSKEIEMYEVYPYPMHLGGNLASPATGAQMNYILAVVEQPASTRLEAEKASYQGAIVAANHPGYSGTGYVDFQNKSGDYIEWDAQVTIPGNYILGFTYSNGSNANRPVQLSINSKSPDQLVFQPSFSWQSWPYLNGPTVYLKPGKHTFRVTAIGASGPNIDFLSLTYQNAGPAGNAPALLVKGKPFQAATLPDALPSANSLQAAPNPFSNSIQISYTLHKAGRVQLRLLNNQGQTVRQLVDGVQLPGNYRIPVSGSGLPAGNYFYHMRVDGKILTSKIVKH